MFYIFRVNHAIASLGIRISSINPDFRCAMQRIGKRVGHSPQEVAIFIAAELPVMYRSELELGPIRKWIRQRKINREDPVIADALAKLGLWDWQ
jgi:hypothetical protein